MNTNHTPAPWVALYDSGTTDAMGQNHRECTFGERHIVASGMRAGSPCIADCGYGRGGRDDVETLANVRLIAAAPDLLMALRDALTTFRDDGKAVLVSAERQEAWIAAITKATGERPEIEKGEEI